MPYVRLVFPLIALASAAGIGLSSLAQTPSAASANVYEAATGRYNAALAEQCPVKHLEWVAPGETPDHNDDFEATLDPVTRASLDPISNALPGGGLAHCPGFGASCGNAVRLAVYDRAGLIPRFAAFMCALPEHCAEQSTCKIDPASQP
jgi:hypothetical protein